MNIAAMSAKGLDINGIKVDGNSDSNSLYAIETIKEAISKVSSQRSVLTWLILGMSGIST